MTTDRTDSTDFLGIAKIREIAKIMRKRYCWAQYKIRSHRNHGNHRKDIALQYHYNSWNSWNSLLKRQSNRRTYNIREISAIRC